MGYCTSNSTKKVIGALMVGAAIGVGLGILFSPAKGSEVRKSIADKSGDWGDAIKEKFNDLVDKFSKEVDEAKEQMS